MDIRRRMLFNSVDTTYAIYYTSSDGDTVAPYKPNVFGANIISNNYINGQGIISFDGPVTTIGDSAFEYCNDLTSITIPDSVTSIGERAFYYCDEFTSVTIPDSVTSIGERAFEDCSSLTSVTIPDNVTTIGGFAFYYCSSLTSVTIPDSVTTIGKGAFWNCTSLRSITIPDSVTTIGDYAFDGCRSFTSVTIPDSVTTIGYSVFANCSSLISVTIPDSVTTIGESAFAHCYGLTSVTIPDSVTEIGKFAFNWCEKLKNVYCKATTPPAGGSSMFSNNASGRKIYVPMESVEAYKSASGWSEYADYIVGYNFEDDGEESGGGSNLTFPVTLVEGDNEQVGVDLFNYLFEKYGVSATFTEEIYFRGTSYSVFDGRILSIINGNSDMLVLSLQNNLNAANIYFYANGKVTLNIYG